MCFSLSEIASGQQIVGSSSIDSNPQGFIHAFVWENGVMTDLGGLGAVNCTPNSFAAGINAAGQIVGTSAPPDCLFFHAVIWQKGAITDLGIGVGEAINNSGAVVGRIFLPGGTSHAALWQNGGVTDLGSFGDSSDAVAINASGQVVGSSRYSGGGLSDHAFLWQNGVMRDLGTLGGSRSFATGINDSGQVVGFSYLPGDASNHAFLWQNGVMTDLGTLGGANSSANAINASGQVTGSAQLPGGFQDAFIWRNGVMTDLGSYAGGAEGNAINASGQIVGDSQVFGPVSYALFWHNGAITDLGNLGGNAHVKATGIRDAGLLLDPVPDLLIGPAVTTDKILLASFGTPVAGVAADGVTQVVIKIPAASVSDQITVTLFNDQSLSGQNILPNEDGGLGKPGDTSFSQSQTTVTAQDTSNGPMAFAIYRAPLDFARQTSTGYKLGVCNGVTDTDDHLACRAVSLQIQDVTAGGAPITAPIAIIRPPVVLIHGLWSTQEETWNNFSPLYSTTGSDPRFHVAFANYSYPVGNLIAASIPSYPRTTVGSALGLVLTPVVRANSLGFQYNSSWVLSQIDLGIRDLKNGKNPLGIPVAAVQADIVGHSMGGDISRTLPLQTNFLRDPNYGQGIIHKLITVDTPHLGSPLATDLLANENSCVSDILGAVGMVAYNTVSLSGGAVYSGAIGDLQGDGAGATLSPALARLTQPGSHALPTALIAGVANNSNYSSLSNAAVTKEHFILTRVCGDFGFQDPLAILLNSPSGWPSVFNNQPSDAVVPFSSEVNQSTFGASYQFTQFSPYIHSPGIGKLGFAGPTIVDAGVVPTRVIQLLNTPVTQPDFNLLNP